MRFAAGDAAALAAILRDAARAEIMPRFRRLGAEGVRAKSSPQDLVTDADEGAERHIAAALAKLFPDALVVGEEAAAADASLLDRLAEADRAIVLDPLDGTFNFAHGVPLFAVMAALLVRGEVVLSAIHDPLGDDTALALRGEGAWVERPDGTRAELRVCGPARPAQMGGIASWQFLPEPLKSRGPRPPAAPGRDLELSLRRARVPAGRLRRVPLPALSPPAALGPRARLAAAPRSRRLLGTFRWRRVPAPADQRRIAVRAGSGELGGAAGDAAGGVAA